MKADSTNEISAERQSPPTAAADGVSTPPETAEPQTLGGTPCSASSFWFIGTAHFGQMDAVAKEYRRAYDALPLMSRPRSLVVWGPNSIIVSDALMHYGLPTIRLTQMVGRTDGYVGVIPDIVREFQSVMSDFNDYVSLAAHSGRREVVTTEEMTDRDKRERVAGADFVDLSVESFVPAGEGGDVGLKHSGRVSNFFAEQCLFSHSELVI